MSGTRLIVLAALIIAVLGEGAPAAKTIEPAPSAHAAAIIRLAGQVDDYRRDTLLHRFRQAEAAGAKTIIIEIDTYGGLVTSAMDISRFLRGQSSVHTIAFVDDKAISAGSMIAMACDEIVMSPGAVLGDCAPIVLDRSGRLEPLPAAERAKLQSPILRDFEDSAKRNGYSPAVVDAMVKVESSVYLVQDSQGQTRVVDEREYDRLMAAGQWKPAAGVVNPIDGPDTLLTVGPDLARRLGLSKGNARSAHDLAQQRGFQIVADLTPGVGDALVEAINSTWARFVLLVVFLLSLYVALHNPGHGAAEAVATLSLGLLIVVPLVTGYAQLWEIVLIFVGLALCAFELFVFPGHGVSLVFGLFLLLAGFVMTFAGSDPGSHWLPQSNATWHHLQTGLVVVVSAMVASIIGAILLRGFLPHTPMFRRLILTETSGARPPTAAGAPVKAGDDVWPFLGTTGVAATDLRPGGIVQFPYGNDLRRASVVSTSGFVSAGTKVIVQEARGNHIVVRTA
jgi:membrane-bound serine protease (ClpP class)